MESTQLAHLVAEASRDKKAKDVVVMDMRHHSPLTDFFVICHGLSNIQVRAIAEHVEAVTAGAGVSLHHQEGFQNARWVLLDYGDVVVHVFHEHERLFYNLERLWGDAQVVHL